MDLQAFHQSTAGKVRPVPGKDYWAFYPEPLEPELMWTAELVSALSKADSALGELRGLGHNLVNPHLLITPFVRREAVLSSEIEGTQASISDLYAYEANQLQLFEYPKDVKEVSNYVKALEYGLERLKSLPISLRLFRELYQQLMEGMRGEILAPGEFRHSQNWIGPPGCLLTDAIFVPPPPDEMLKALGDLETYLHTPSQLPSLVRLGLIHYQFEMIHPFLDGNGRVGRLLITLLLCNWGLLPQPLLYLSAYLHRHRDEYYSHLLAVSQRGEWSEWLIYFLQGVYTQCKDSISRSRRLLNLRKQYREQFQNQRAAARLLQVIDVLFARPVITINSLSGSIEDINYQSAYRYVNFLVDKGILSCISSNARNRIYQADDILDAITSPVNNE
jgi:Fic family protein